MTCEIYLMKKCKTGTTSFETFYRKVKVYANDVEEVEEKDFSKGTIKVPTAFQNQYAGPTVFKLIDLLSVKNTFILKGAIKTDYDLTTLNGAVGAADTTINVTDATQLTALIGGAPTTSRPGFILLDNEVIKFTGVSTNTLTGCTRGWFGTTATTHSSGGGVHIPAYNWKMQMKYIMNDGGSFYLYYGADPSITTDPVSPTSATYRAEVWTVNSTKMSFREQGNDTPSTPSFYDVTLYLMEGENIS